MRRAIPPLLKFVVHLPVRCWMAGPVSGLLVTGRSFRLRDCFPAFGKYIPRPWISFHERLSAPVPTQSVPCALRNAATRNQNLPVTQWNQKLCPFALERVLNIWNPLEPTLTSSVLASQSWSHVPPGVPAGGRGGCSCWAPCPTWWGPGQCSSSLWRGRCAGNICQKHQAFAFMILGL